MVNTIRVKIDVNVARLELHTSVTGENKLKPQAYITIKNIAFLLCPTEFEMKEILGLRLEILIKYLLC